MYLGCVKEGTFQTQKRASQTLSQKSRTSQKIVRNVIRSVTRKFLKLTFLSGQECTFLASLYREPENMETSFFSEDWDSKVIYLHLHLFIRRPHTAFHSFLAISHPSWIGYQTKGIDRVVSVFGISVFQKATFSVILFFVQDMEYGAAKLEARTALSIDLESKNCVDPRRSKLLHLSDKLTSTFLVALFICSVLQKSSY